MNDAEQPTNGEVQELLPANWGETQSVKGGGLRPLTAKDLDGLTEQQWADIFKEPL